MAATHATQIDSELARVSARLNWLDEERRKDKETIAALQQRLISQESALTESTKRIQELEGRLSATQTQVAKLPRVDISMDKLRKEMNQLVEEVDARRQVAERETEKLRRVEHEMLSRAVSEVKKELPTLPRILEEFPPLKAEDQRLSALVATIQHQLAAIENRIDAHIRDLSYIEEGRRQDTRRIGELQQEISEFRKKLETLPPRLEVVQDLAMRNEVRIEEVQQLEVQRTQAQARWIDQQQLAQVDRDHRIRDATEHIEVELKRIDDWEPRMARYADQVSAAVATVSQLPQFQERIEHQQKELAEIQRIAEERLKGEWTEFLLEQDRKWKHFSYTWDERWKSHDRPHRQLEERLSAIEKFPEPLWVEIKALWQMHENYDQVISTFSRQWAAVYEERLAKTRGKPAAVPASAPTSGGPGNPGDGLPKT